jgi:N,N-dimethylformamidase
MGIPVHDVHRFPCDYEATGGFASDCQWPVSFQLEVADWDPGFYAARISGPQGASYDIPFVVKRGRVLGEVALLVNVNTWNAYNTWGGGSNYTGTLNPITLTMKRPNHHLLSYVSDHPNGTHLLRSEIWLHSWLRACGYRSDLYTDIDLERTPEVLSSYKALIISTHPEYWTKTMMAGASGYLDVGGSIMYLGGNGMYRPTHLQAEHPGEDLDRTVTETSQWPLDEYPLYETKPLLAACVENLGGSPPGKGVAVRDAQHRFMPGGLDVGDVVGFSGWNGNPPFGASGWETDHWPATPAGVSELARDPRNHGLGAVISTYETTSGGCVLGVGSLTFVGSLMEDPVLQELIQNALAYALSKRRPIDA